MEDSGFFSNHAVSSAGTTLATFHLQAGISINSEDKTLTMLFN